MYSGIPLSHSRQAVINSQLMSFVIGIAFRGCVRDFLMDHGKGWTFLIKGKCALFYLYYLNLTMLIYIEKDIFPLDYLWCWKIDEVSSRNVFIFCFPQAPQNTWFVLHLYVAAAKTTTFRFIDESPMYSNVWYRILRCIILSWLLRYMLSTE